MIDDEQAADEGYSADDLKKLGGEWIDRIEACEKREKKWIDNATKAEAIYLMDEDECDDGLPAFNILHSNVETIVPSIYNSSPRPDIRPRHNNKDPIGKAVSDILERAISTQIDDNRLDAEIEGSAQDAFMAGRGIVRVKFDAQEVPAQIEMQPMADPMTGEVIMQEIEVAPARLTGEKVVFETVSWRDYREGPAKRWGDVPWVAFRHEVTETELERLEDPELAEKQKDPNAPPEGPADESIWEIWCKETGQVYFIAEASHKVISITPDPLGLTGFFPISAPVQPITGTGKRTPVCPYAVYEALADELDRATKRINRVMQGLKVRGIIAGDAEAMELLANVGDNELVPVANIENLVAAGGLDKAIMWWPVDQAIAVLQQLYVQREQTKQAIYEITGISDIIRGQGAASETATAQQIKTQWGALRVKKMQRMIERQVRDLFVLASEIISQHFSFETLQQITGIQIDEQMATLLQKPMDHYRIDVESDSTVRADLTQRKGEMSEFLQGTAQFFSTMQPIVAAEPKAAAPMAKMYASFARQFNLGREGEDAIQEMAEMAEESAKQEQGPTPEQEAQMAELQMKMQEMQGKQQLEQQKLQLQNQNLQLDAQVKQADLGLKQADLMIKRDSLELEEAKATLDAAARAVEIDMELDQERAVKIGNE